MSLSLTAENLKNHVHTRIFFETGTFTGGGVSVARAVGFERIISIEIYEPYQKANIKRFAGLPGIELHTGDSEELLWPIIKDINEPITFFLDSHIVVQTGNVSGIREIPLLQELEIISRHPIKSHVLLIDDRRMMGHETHPGGWISQEWTDILEEHVMKSIYTINPDYNIYYEDTVNGKQDLIIAKVQ